MTIDSDTIRQWHVRICKDGTLTIAKRKEASFNDAALPLVGCDTKYEAEVVIAHYGTMQHKQHPEMPGEPWMKVWDFGGELDDLYELRDRIVRFYARKEVKA